MKKQFKHEKIEICKLCKKEIDTEEDLYAVLIDYGGKKQHGIGFYHRDCLRDLFEAKGKVIHDRFQEKLKGFVGNMLSKNNLRNLQIEA